jgi:hypothetical protein
MVRATIGGIAGSEAREAADNTVAIALCLLVPSVIYYALLVTALGSTGLFSPVTYGLTFNSMLLHLLDRRFDVDPAAIGPEGYLRDGAIYAYFGIFPALFRALFLPLPSFATYDFTRISCLVAGSIMALFKLLSVLLVWRRAGMPQRTRLLLPLLMAVVLVSGAQIPFLRPSIFQEAMLWAGAFAAVFVFLVLYGWSREEGFTSGLLAALAAVAGLCLLTRVSTALGLYLALGFIWLWRARQEFRASAAVTPRRVAGMLLPIVILLAFAGAAAIVNQARWGNPLTFADLSRALMLTQYPDRLARLHQYGEFNPVRLGYGLLYYFFPIWVLRDGSSQLLWSDYVQRTIDSVELPPSSFLISDPLLVGLAIYGLILLFRRSGDVPERAPIALASLGLAVPIMLMLCAISMTFRYRMEFYPIFELCAFIGFFRLLGKSTRRLKLAFGGGALVSIVVAHALWVLHMLSPSGPAAKFMGHDSVIGFYASMLH